MITFIVGLITLVLLIILLVTSYELVLVLIFGTFWLGMLYQFIMYIGKLILDLI